jgi:dTDP-4-dehydrorhamnose 3,5-epimerase-like enzyme
MNRNTVYDCTVVDLPQVHNDAGNITAVENNKNIPFEIKRIYYLYDIPGGEGRGAHAHKKLQQFIIAASGSFDVVLDDGNAKRVITLNHPNRALHIVPGIWRELRNFSSGAICLVLASEVYDEGDYLRNYKNFILWKSK